jgi:hypothetical protein
MRPALPVAALAAVLALAGSAALACPPPSEGFQRRTLPNAEVAYRWDPAELKVGQFFAVEVIVCPTPGSNVTVSGIDAIMPAHGHGMNYRPRAERIAPDRYRFTGLMLHMPGKWLITFSIGHGATGTDLGVTRLLHEVNLER